MSYDSFIPTGQNPIAIKSVTYAEALEPLQMIRRRVFQEEQGVPPELEFDGYDDAAHHLLAYLNNDPVGTLRIRYLPPFTAKIERLAVLAIARDQGIGKQLMQMAMDHIKAQQQWEWIQLNAQIQVQTFYEKLGFQAIGEEFQEAGIPHIQMVKYLQLS
jgi:ribosomal protein S18 acetylase RimI-like enzyme